MCPYSLHGGGGRAPVVEEGEGGAERMSECLFGNLCNI